MMAEHRARLRSPSHSGLLWTNLPFDRCNMRLPIPFLFVPSSARPPRLPPFILSFVTLSPHLHHVLCSHHPQSLPCTLPEMSLFFSRDRSDPPLSIRYRLCLSRFYYSSWVVLSTVVVCVVRACISLLLRSGFFSSFDLDRIGKPALPPSMIPPSPTLPFFAVLFFQSFRPRGLSTLPVL